MREYKLKSRRSRVKGFPYMLTEWLPKKQDLIPFIEPFKKYKEEKDGVIIESPAGFAIFTKGESHAEGLCIS